MKLILKTRQIEVPGVESFFFDFPEPLSWKAGQYGHYVLHHEPTDDRGSDRWFTVSAAPFEKVIRITTRFTDDKGSSFKKVLRDLKIGKYIEISNLSGDFVIEDETLEYVFIAGGIGITPFRSILKEFDYQGKQFQVNLLYANKDQNILFKEELEELTKSNPNFAIHYIVSPEHIDESKIRQLVPDLQAPLFYVSGPESMVEELGNLLKTMGIDETKLKQDWFPGYEN